MFSCVYGMVWLSIHCVILNRWKFWNWFCRNLETSLISDVEICEISERDRLTTCKPLPSKQPMNQYRPDLALAPEVYNHLRGLQKKAKDLRTEVKTLRRLAQTQAVAVREDIKDTFMRIRATLLATSGNTWGQCDQERVSWSMVSKLEKDLNNFDKPIDTNFTRRRNLQARGNQAWERFGGFGRFSRGAARRSYQ